MEIDADPNHDLLVAEADGTIVGTFEMMIMRSVRRGGICVAEIESVVVDERAAARESARR